jgi:aminoglycoside phosphotransferase (APT) family kinase protein
MTWSTVAPAVERTTDETVLDHEPLDSVASDVYEATLSESGRVVVKVPRIEDGRLSMPRLLDLVRERTDVPVPPVLAVQETTDPSFLVLAFVEGRRVDHPDDLSPRNLRRFAREFGETLGALHEMALPLETFGRIRCDEAGLHTVEGFDSWRPRFEDTMAVNLDALDGLGLGDLADPVRAHLDDAVDAVPDVTTPALNYYDCKVENVVLSPDPDGRLFEAVLDWESLETTHWAYPLAFPETSFVRRQSVLPAADVLSELHEGYADARGWASVPLDEEWFDTYRLAALVLRAASPHWLDARDDWTDEDAEWLRSSIEAML